MKIPVLGKHDSTLGENLGTMNPMHGQGVNMSWALICVILNATKYHHQGSVDLLAYDLPSRLMP